MVQLPVMNTSGKQVDTVELPADIFEVEVNVGLMHQAYVRQMANARQGTASTRRRGEIRMTGAKAYRQKGTGRARHGARSAPIFVGGGGAHGPKPRQYTQNMPKKMRQGALKSALSALVRDEQVVIVDKFDIEQPKTREMKQMLTAIVGSDNALVLFTRGNEVVRSSVKNLPKADALLVNYLNIRDLLKHDKVVIPLDALEEIKSIWGQEG